MITDKIISQRIRKARKQKNMTQAQVALRIGILRSALVQAENGNRKISAVELSKLCKVYDMNPYEFLCDLNMSLLDH